MSIGNMKIVMHRNNVMFVNTVNILLKGHESLKYPPSVGMRFKLNKSFKSKLENEKIISQIVGIS